MEPWIDRFKALADETRVVLLAALLDEELSVGDLAEIVQAAQPGVSRHLAALREAGLVAARRQGTATFYRLASGDPLLDGPFAGELRRLRTDRKLAARVERVLARRRAKAESFFDQAEDWDTLRAELFADAAGFASLLALVPRGLVVADVGTGTGGMLPYLGAVAERIEAVDLSAEMLKRARAKAKALGLENVVFRKGDFESLPLESASVDASFCALALHHATRPAVALRDMARIVRPGGAVVVVDLVAHGQEWLRDEQADLWLGFSEKEIQSLFSQAGLTSFHHRVVSRVAVSAAKNGRGQSLELFVASGRREAALH